MSDGAGMKRALPWIETAMTGALVAWIGGMFALGAFSARILFRDLPRETAAPAMSTIFRSFDGVVVACVVIVALATGLRLLAVGLRQRCDRIALTAGTALTILGAIDVGYVHPSIARMQNEGRTLEPAFHALHTLSSRSFNLEAICAILIVGAYAWSRRDP
jgi:hypothetical protein